MRLTFVLTCATLYVTIVSGKVLINRCCPENHVLVSESCRLGKTTRLAPAVYSPVQGGFLSPGTVPEDWEYVVAKPSACDDPKFYSTLEAQLPPFVLVPTGQLLMSDNIAEPKPQDSFCLDVHGALVCSTEYLDNKDANNKITVPKCCGEGGAFSERNSSCVPSLTEQSEFSSNITWLHRFPECESVESSYTIMGKLDVGLWINPENGTLVDDRGRVWAKTDFCLEKILEYPEDPVHVIGCPVTSEPRATHDIRFTIYPIGMFLSVFFLAVTLVASCLLPSTYHVLHWRCQTNHVACLLIGDLLLAVTQLSGDALQGKGCVSIGMVKMLVHHGRIMSSKREKSSHSSMYEGITHLSGDCDALHIPRCILLAQHYVFQHLVDIQVLGVSAKFADASSPSEIWTYTIICLVHPFSILEVLILCSVIYNNLSHPLITQFSIFGGLIQMFLIQTIFQLIAMSKNQRDFRPTNLDKGQEACRLRIYELYAWGGPLVISGVGAVLDNVPRQQGDHNFIRPRFGENRCFFYGDVEMLYYFYGPIGVLLIMNLTLFAATARELTCGLWKTEVVKSNTERATLGRVCLKLVVVMGITWVVDVVSWVVGGPDYVWYLTDIINSLQGVLIFAVVGCQPQVWAAVKRLWCLKNSPNDTNNARSSSSHALPSMNDHNTSVTNTSKAAETLC